METQTKTKTALAKSLSFDKLGFIYPDIDPNSPQMDQVCQFFNDAGRDYGNAKAYGEELVKRYNMHNELVKALKIMVEKRKWGGTQPSVSIDEQFEIRELLKQAE